MAFFHDHILSIILFIPLVGMIPLFLIPGENKQAIRWWGNVVLFVDFLASLPLVFWFSSETPAQQFKFIELHAWIPSIGAQYHLGIDGISFLLIMLTTVLGFHRRPLVLDSHPGAREGILRHVPAAPGGDAGRFHVARFLPLLRVLGSHAGSDVLHHRSVGWAAQALCRHQVLPLHVGRLRPDAAGNPDALPQLHAARRQAHVRPHRADEAHAFLAVANADLGLHRLRHRFRHQGADVPVPHLVAGCARRGAHRGLGDPGGRFAEDGHVRLHPLLAAPAAAKPAPIRRS